MGDIGHNAPEALSAGQEGLGVSLPSRGRDHRESVGKKGGLGFLRVIGHLPASGVTANDRTPLSSHHAQDVGVAHAGERNSVAPRTLATDRGT